MAETPARKPLPRPLPTPCHTTKPFWEAARQGKLALQYDPLAKRYQFWPRPISVITGQQNLEWRVVSGLGHVYSYTITHVPAAGFEGKTPYIVALIELDEGVRMIANMINVRPEGMNIGMRVKVDFEKLSDEINFFAFEPTE